MSIKADDTEIGIYMADAYDWLTKAPTEIRSVNCVDISLKMRKSLERCFEMMPDVDKMNFISEVLSLDYSLAKFALTESMRVIDWFSHERSNEDRELFLNVSLSLKEIADQD